MPVEVIKFILKRDNNTNWNGKKYKTADISEYSETINICEPSIFDSIYSEISDELKRIVEPGRYQCLAAIYYHRKDETNNSTKIILDEILLLEYYIIDEPEETKAYRQEMLEQVNEIAKWSDVGPDVG